jgi:hypothetical protein
MQGFSPGSKHLGFLFKKDFYEGNPQRGYGWLPQTRKEL